uniref:WRKY27-1 transcription factor n=1 Tax=Solanum tuberosum TaxID=4113 RepID=M1DGI5_SOLTU
MGDDDWDVGAAVRSCNINRPDNVVAPKLDLETSLNDVWNSFDKLFAPDITNFNDLSEIFSLDFPAAHQEKPDDQTPLIQTRTRNYYKCSTSKLCEARKKIEKSPNDENIFLVSYSGEHNHDPPTNHRNLASCNSSSKFKLPKGINILPKTSTLNASSTSSKRIKCSRDVASPIIATMPPLEFGNKNKMIVAAVEDKGDGKEEVGMNEDILMGFE